MILKNKTKTYCSNKKIFFGDKFIQNSPHSPDIAYPIETLWAELKRRVKDRNPKNLDELKKITIEEWNKMSAIISLLTGINMLSCIIHAYILKIL